MCTREVKNAPGRSDRRRPAALIGVCPLRAKTVRRVIVGCSLAGAVGAFRPQAPGEVCFASGSRLEPRGLEGQSTCPRIRRPCLLRSTATGQDASSAFFGVSSDGFGVEAEDIWRQQWDVGTLTKWPVLPQVPAVTSTFTARDIVRPQKGGEVVKKGQRVQKPWEATKQESQAMQELILDAQGDAREMLRLLLANPLQCNHVNVCTVLHRCGRLSELLRPEVREDIQNELMPVVAQVLPRCQPRQLSNVAWAMAKLGLVQTHGDVFDRVVGRLGKPGTFEACKVGEIAMVVWSIATAGLAVEHTEFFNRSAELVADRGDALRPKELGLITWAYATWLQADKEVEDESEEPDRGWLLRPVQALIDTTLHVEEQLQPRDIAMLAWAFGRLAQVDWNALGPKVDMLCAVLSSSAVKQISHFSAKDLAELAVGVVAMQYDNANLMQVIAMEASKKIRAFSHRELSNLIWAYGKVFRRPRKFILLAVEEARARLEYFNPTELANVAWALIVLEVYETRLFAEIFGVARRRIHELQEGDLNQLYQVTCILRLRAPEALGSLSPELERAMHRAWASNKQREKRRTNRQAAVSRVLESLRIEHQLEADHDIDILMRRGDEVVALEVDGPAHFLRNSGHPMGHTIMKRRLLSLLGYRVVSIPHFEWDRIPYWSSMELKRYIQRKCNLGPILQFSSQDVSNMKQFPKFGKKTRFD